MKPMSRADIIRCLKSLGFKGPVIGQGPHPSFMIRGTVKLQLPNPHKKKDVYDPLLSKLKRQAEVTDEECKSA
ncbi:MAG: hypothetical protein CVU90_08835 [Firmicutes bacterium HGW-Firmicutes-15]|nr:MAG: hypothetical protein CVU90_08835 [Firmicutes bacterium HGW-Firmicutes-15]